MVIYPLEDLFHLVPVCHHLKNKRKYTELILKHIHIFYI